MRGRISTTANKEAIMRPNVSLKLLNRELHERMGYRRYWSPSQRHIELLYLIVLAIWGCMLWWVVTHW